MYIWFEAGKKGSVLHSLHRSGSSGLSALCHFLHTSPSGMILAVIILYTNNSFFRYAFPLSKAEKFRPTLLPYCGMLLGETAIKQE